MTPSPAFVTTHWSVVLAAKDKSSPDAAAALEALCSTYWYPLYAFVRSTGKSPHDSQDLTQEFFARFLAKEWLKVAQPEKGKFRTLLLTALKRFMSNEWHRASTLKRGGGWASIPLETANAEERFAVEPALAPDQLFERRWAMTLLKNTFQDLARDFTATGRGDQFDVLKQWLTADRGQIPYATLATTLGTTEAAARVAVHRLRKRFREAFRARVADTVAPPANVEEELRHIVAVLTAA